MKDLLIEREFSYSHGKLLNHLHFPVINSQSKQFALSIDEVCSDVIMEEKIHVHLNTLYDDPVRL